MSCCRREIFVYVCLYVCLYVYVRMWVYLSGRDSKFASSLFNVWYCICLYTFVIYSIDIYICLFWKIVQIKHLIWFDWWIKFNMFKILLIEVWLMRFSYVCLDHNYIILYKFIFWFYTTLFSYECLYILCLKNWPRTEKEGYFYRRDWTSLSRRQEYAFLPWMNVDYPGFCPEVMSRDIVMGFWFAVAMIIH